MQLCYDLISENHKIELKYTLLTSVLVASVKLPSIIVPFGNSSKAAIVALFSLRPIFLPQRLGGKLVVDPRVNSLLFLFQKLSSQAQLLVLLSSYTQFFSAGRLVLLEKFFCLVS